ncbi:helix-turn-helix domain-containing protein [Sphingobacterium paludis]|uniref:AraC-like DNA-binding protein n=1 Tax=Sphingobacterium paludis TaxID=1476465 RepID=A0A4R7CQB7_9SPHI|nr:helix-turn-helix domain-containing protein [Sphingobacterium paludis]TDS06561.1 AraC-like DNA-binding protein [Sphingobacterium paludis]
MRKSAYIIADTIFGPIQKVEHYDHSNRTIILKESQSTYRKLGGQSIFEQDYKGRYSYLHHLALVLSATLQIPICIKLKDLYGVYLLHGATAITLESESGDKIFDLRPQYALYAYLPPGNYQLIVKPGYYQIFSFYFDVGYLNGLRKQEITFLEKLQNAHLINSAQPIHSADFKVGEVTTTFIKQMGNNLTKGNWNSELYVLDQLQTLLQLSKEKIIKQGVIHHGYDIPAELIKKMIENGVDQSGMQFEIKSLSRDIPLSLQHLNRLFKNKYGITLTAYKKKYIIEKSIPLLIRKIPIIGICEILEMKNERTFYRLFQKLNGMNTNEFLDRLNSKRDIKATS